MNLLQCQVFATVLILAYSLDHSYQRRNPSKRPTTKLKIPVLSDNVCMRN